MKKKYEITLEITYVPAPEEHIHACRAGFRLLLQLLKKEAQCQTKTETQSPSKQTTTLND